ncbi:DUF1934 domain-containing protein [Staphylococcus condimenti]|uniref:DUF1934 family protein n=1 Tax=Staphylococcus condimenti TaxID=70255 RepID=A0A143PBW3_9STAP|nr:MULTISPECIES: DUF1934 family protein [Staphylococcus]AMY05588.1 hypothetical protein A4G25_06390 [Staphylococcus condimenti]APR61795.1 hypothetical protein BTZ13_11415 [Staphylococcus condimenti]MDK8645670.1 DUF1934 family protein [Staphylococcus condimenti]OFO99429.1 hypothetical protein HMPREF3007_06040 [Staphylococcus sp. HMSC065E08]PNZ62489.1 DUF1934 domain-containing protein [Staphylococcus condimenti]
MDQNIHIQTLQVIKRDGETDEFEYETNGTWQEKRQVEYIRFDEQIEDITIHVTLKIQDGEVKLMRNGEIKQNLHFVEGKDTVSLYEIPAGKIPLTVRTLSINHFIQPEMSKLKIRYELFQDEEKMGTYLYQITYKELT